MGWPMEEDDFKDSDDDQEKEQRAPDAMEQDVIDLPCALDPGGVGPDSLCGD